MPEYKYSLNVNEFKTNESIICRQVMKVPEKDAILFIQRRDCLAFVEKRDKQVFTPPPTAHSYRIKLTIKKGIVINAEVG